MGAVTVVSAQLCGLAPTKKRTDDKKRDNDHLCLPDIACAQQIALSASSRNRQQFGAVATGAVLVHQRSMMKARAEQLEKALRAAGVRLTRQRVALLRVIAASEDHPDAAELHRRAEAAGAGVSLATVYRTLTTLQAQGVIDKLEFQGEPARWEAADQSHHDHMIDVDSGEVIEFTNDRIERLQAEIAAEMGYELVHHRLELYVRKVR